MRLLLQGYNKAVEQINRKEQTDSIRNILLGYPVEPETIDTLKIPAYPQAQKGGKKRQRGHSSPFFDLPTFDYA